MKLTWPIARDEIRAQTQEISSDLVPAKPLISVMVVTYNHREFIQQAVESVLDQITDDPVEILIGDDGSTDGTREIVREFQQRHPDRIRLFVSAKRLGRLTGNGRLNWIRLFEAARGDYVALIEGDDYWTDRAKLARQVALLKNDFGYSACFHNARVVNTRGGCEREWIMHNDRMKDAYGTTDLLRQWFIPTASLVFRRDAAELPEWTLNTQSMDIPLILILSLRGNLKYLPEVLSVYRQHPGGISTTHFGVRKAIAMAYVYESFNIETSRRFEKEIHTAMFEEWRYHLRDALLRVEAASNADSSNVGSSQGFVRLWPLRVLQWIRRFRTGLRQKVLSKRFRSNTEQSD